MTQPPDETEGEERERHRMEVAKSLIKASKTAHGHSLEFTDPEKCARLIERLAEGHGRLKIAREEGVNMMTLARLRVRHAELIDKRKEMVAADALAMVEGVRMLQHEKMEMLAEDPAALRRTNLRDLALSYGIYADKFFMATEGNKVTIEHRQGAPSIADAQKAIEEARSKLRKESVEVVVEQVVKEEQP